MHQAVGELQAVFCDSVTVSSALITASAFVQDKSSSLGRSELNTGLCRSFFDSFLETEQVSPKYQKWLTVKVRLKLFEGMQQLSSPTKKRVVELSLLSPNHVLHNRKL